MSCAPSWFVFIRRFVCPSGLDLLACHYFTVCVPLASSHYNRTEHNHLTTSSILLAHYLNLNFNLNFNLNLMQHNRWISSHAHLGTATDLERSVPCGCLHAYINFRQRIVLAVPRVHHIHTMLPTGIGSRPETCGVFGAWLVGSILATRMGGGRRAWIPHAFFPLGCVTFFA